MHLITVSIGPSYINVGISAGENSGIEYLLGLLVDLFEYIDRIVGESISEADAHRLLTSLQTRGMVSVRERLLIEISLRHIAELCDTTFDVSPYKKGVMQADLLKRMLCGLDLV